MNFIAQLVVVIARLGKTETKFDQKRKFSLSFTLTTTYKLSHVNVNISIDFFPHLTTMSRDQLLTFTSVLSKVVKLMSCLPFHEVALHLLSLRQSSCIWSPRCPWQTWCCPPNMPFWIWILNTKGQVLLGGELTDHTLLCLPRYSNYCRLNNSYAIDHLGPRIGKMWGKQVLRALCQVWCLLVWP